MRTPAAAYPSPIPWRPVALALALVAALPACSSKSTTTPASSTTTPDAAAPAGPAEPYTLTAYDAVRITSKQDDPGFQKAVADIDLHDGPFASAKLVVDLGTTCFPFETRAKPPTGQNWPADCDAFDRNFDIHIDQPATADGPPGFEVMHAITPFGGPLHNEIDITDLANGLAPGKHTITTHITTWSDGAGKVSGSNGGWTVSAHIDVTPGAAPHKVLAVKSLIDTSVTAADGIPALAFEAPAGTTSARLEVRTSGHGGGTGGADCIGPAEEFCRRTHTFTLDGAQLTTKSAWRAYCQKLCTVKHYGPATGGFDYCLENPCGNMDSVRAPRANWCPGSETAPFTFEDATLAAPGAHTLGWSINLIEGGGLWTTSATYFAFGD